MFKSVILSFFLSSMLLAQNSSRVEELFIWKISEELGLSVKEERELSALIRDLNQKKSAANDGIQKVIQKMAAESDREKSKKWLKEYRKAMLAYNEITVKEIDAVERILDPHKAQKYIIVKADLSQKIKSLLTSTEKPADRIEKSSERARVERSGPMPEPKIIEE